MWASLLLLGLGLAQPAPKNELSRPDLPVDITAQGGLSIDLKKKTGTAKGDVLIRREDVLVCCDEATAKYSGKVVEVVTCRGRVVIVRNDGTKATADVAVFRARQDRITLTGQARIWAEETDLSGQEIVYDIARDQIEVQGKKSSFRFDPKSQPKLPARACPPKPEGRRKAP